MLNTGFFGVDIGSRNVKLYNSRTKEIFNIKNIVAIKNKMMFDYGDGAYEMYEKTPTNIQCIFPVTDGVITDMGNMISPKLYKKYFSSMNALQETAISLFGQKNLIEYKVLPVILDKITKSSDYKIDFKTIKVEGSDIHLNGYVIVPKGVY